MTLEQLARHLGMNAREVRRLADRGSIPGHYLGGHWRFNRAQMLDWLQAHMHGLSPADIRNLEQAMTDPGAESAVVTPLLAIEAIELSLPARSANSVLRELVRVAERTGHVYDTPAIVAALEERESQRSTALAGGFAFPHPRRPLPNASAEPLLCIARVPAGVPFSAPDGNVTDLFVFVLSHDERGHLRTLARLSRMFMSGVAESLRNCETPEEALAVMVAAELPLSG